MSKLSLSNFFSGQNALVRVSAPAVNQLQMRMKGVLTSSNHDCDVTCMTAPSRQHHNSGVLTAGFGMNISQNKVVAGQHLITNFRSHGYTGNGPLHKYASCTGTCSDKTGPLEKQCKTMNFEIENGNLASFDHADVMCAHEFHSADTNNYGVLHPHEHAAAYHHTSHAALDTNKDGKLTLGEATGSTEGKICPLACSTCQAPTPTGGIPLVNGVCNQFCSSVTNLCEEKGDAPPGSTDCTACTDPCPPACTTCLGGVPLVNGVCTNFCSAVSGLCQEKMDVPSGSVDCTACTALPGLQPGAPPVCPYQYPYAYSSNGTAVGDSCASTIDSNGIPKPSQGTVSCRRSYNADVTGGSAAIMNCIDNPVDTRKGTAVEFCSYGPGTCGSYYAPHKIFEPHISCEQNDCGTSHNFRAGPRAVCGYGANAGELCPPGTCPPPTKCICPPGAGPGLWPDPVDQGANETAVYWHGTYPGPTTNETCF